MGNHLIKINLFLVWSFCCTTAIAQTNSNFYFELPNGNGNFCAPLMVQFTNASTAINPAFSWKINGQVFSEKEDPSWIFLTAGTYKICLEVTDDLGKDQNCQIVQFFDAPKIPMEVASLTSEL